MGTWTELYFERGITENASGNGFTRGWSVVGSAPDVARTEPEAPHRNDPHPDDPLMVINTVTFSPTGYGTQVLAQYVPVEFLDPTPPEDTTGLDWTKIDTDHEDEDIDIPVFELVTKQFPTAGGGTEEKKVWKRKDNAVPFRKSVVVHRLTVNATVSSGLGVAAQFALTDLIKDQHNKIHTINGRKMLFRAGGTRRIEKDKYQFNYEWYEDPGIPYLLDFIIRDNDGIALNRPGLAIIGSEAFPVAGPFNGQLYVIPPFGRVDTAPDATDPTKYPKVEVGEAYEEDVDGWQILPGLS